MLGFDGSLHARDDMENNSRLSDICIARQALAGVDLPQTAASCCNIMQSKAVLNIHRSSILADIFGLYMLEGTSSYMIPPDDPWPSQGYEFFRHTPTA